jgi:hypothetical protein
MSIYRVETDEEGQPFSFETSIAISLKRIADALEKLAKPPMVADADLISDEELMKGFSHMVNKA